jgi:proline iminopeptidase
MTGLLSVLAAIAMATAGIPPEVRPSPPPVAEGTLAGADGVRIFYRKVGAGGPLVVYLHGGPGSNFRGNGTDMDALAQGRTLVMYDQRGGGRSEIVTDPALLTARHHVRDLEAIRQNLGAERMTLVGLSWGSGLAALYASEHPARVSRLLFISPISPTRALFDQRLTKLRSLLGPAAAARQREIRERLPRADDRETVELCREASDLVFRLYLARPTPAKLRHAQERCDIPPAAIRNRPVVEAAALQSLGDWDFRPLLQGLKVPALVLEGTESNVPLQGTREWANALSQGRLKLIPRAGHELFLDQPVAFLKAAEDFLAQR